MQATIGNYVGKRDYAALPMLDRINISEGRLDLYIRTCSITYIHTYKPTNLDTYIPAYLRTCILTYLHACMHAYVPRYLPTGSLT